MALNQVSTGNTILAFDINQMVQVLQRLTGQTETGKYFLQSGAANSGWILSLYMPTLSRNATPSGVTIDTTDVAPTSGAGTPGTGNLTANGFQIFSAATANSNTARCAGNWTVSF